MCWPTLGGADATSSASGASAMCRGRRDGHSALLLLWCGQQARRGGHAGPDAGALLLWMRLVDSDMFVLHVGNITACRVAACQVHKFIFCSMSCPLLLTVLQFFLSCPCRSIWTLQRRQVKKGNSPIPQVFV